MKNAALMELMESFEKVDEVSPNDLLVKVVTYALGLDVVYF
jgi:hypothetical protein